MRLNKQMRALRVLVPAACLLVLPQCGDFMTTQPFGSLNTGTFYNTPRDFEAALVGAYSTVQGLTWSGRDQSLFQIALRPDDDTRGPGNNTHNDFTWNAGHFHIQYIWDVAYRGVLRSNLILEQLEQTTLLTDAQRARYAGEAKFVRAYFYFLLARYWGNVPLVTTVASSVEETRPGHSDPAALWDQIENDLRDAVQGLAGLNLEAGRASEWAARALLGKVQIYRAQWFNQPAKYGEAVGHLEAVVNSGRFSLVNYEDNFKHTTENNAESLFELQASFGNDINGWAGADENGGGASSGTGRPLATGAGGNRGINAPGGFDWGDGGIVVTQTLANAFEDGDPRAYFTFYSTGEQYGRACPAAPNGTPVPYNFVWDCGGAGGSLRADTAATFGWSITGHTPAKYIRPYENFAGGQMLNQSVSQNNERLIRYADVLLLLAEAKLFANNDVAGAAALVNQVRARARNAWDRAYGAQSTDATLYANRVRPANLLPDRPASASVDQMLQWLMHERRVELALELHRYDDLVRWHRAGLINLETFDFGDEIANANWRPIHLLRPIPQRELDLNPSLSQNAGF